MAKKIFQEPDNLLAEEECDPKRWCVFCEEWVTPLSDGKGCPCCWSQTMSKEEKQACEQGI